MIAVKMNRAMRPFGQGDIAMLPDDIAQQVIAAGDGEQATMPTSPHAHELGQGEQQRPAVDKKRNKFGLPRQTYLTKDADTLV